MAALAVLKTRSDFGDYDVAFPKIGEALPYLCKGTPLSRTDDAIFRHSLHRNERHLFFIIQADLGLTGVDKTEML